MKKVRAALVGSGNIGKYVLEALLAALDFEVAGVVRRNGAADKPAELAEYDVEDDFAITIPAGTEHNVVNTGDVDMKLYSIYTPTEHPKGTVHVTKADADAAEHSH
jgi:glyceraldehyde-3-phosphate dehydrogenase/erythrose-4-phosphate dehydrogenase